jgi:hypothetical protein
LDGRQLLTAGQIAELDQLARKHAGSPKIGQATVYEPLNIHNEPNRQAPGFAQIPEKASSTSLATVWSRGCPTFRPS